METTKYRIDTCLEQAKKIKEEHPNISMLVFDLENCPYNDMVALDEKAILFRDGSAELDIRFFKTEGHPVTTVVSLKSKKLMVTTTVTEE